MLLHLLFHARSRGRGSVPARRRAGRRRGGLGNEQRGPAPATRRQGDYSAATSLHSLRSPLDEATTRRRPPPVLRRRRHRRRAGNQRRGRHRERDRKRKKEREERGERERPSSLAVCFFFLRSKNDAEPLLFFSFCNLFSLSQLPPLRFSLTAPLRPSQR